MKKALIIPLAALSLVAVAGYLQTQVFASEKANLSRANSASYIAERADFRAERQDNFGQQLAEAVASGELTAEQEQLILAKHAEMADRAPAQMGQRENWRELSVAEREAERNQRQADREAVRAELEQWASDNGIDLEYFANHAANQGRNGFGRRDR